MVHDGPEVITKANILLPILIIRTIVQSLIRLSYNFKMTSAISSALNLLTLLSCDFVKRNFLADIVKVQGPNASISDICATELVEPGVLRVIIIFTYLPWVGGNVYVSADVVLPIVAPENTGRQVVPVPSV